MLFRLGAASKIGNGRIVSEQAVEDGSTNPLRSFAAHLTAPFGEMTIGTCTRE